MTTIDLQDCRYIRHNSSLKVSSRVTGRRFPETVMVRSHHTGRVVKFVQDSAAAIRNEFWDGEAMQYKPAEYLRNVNILFIYHS